MTKDVTMFSYNIVGNSIVLYEVINKFDSYYSLIKIKVFNNDEYKSFNNSFGQIEHKVDNAIMINKFIHDYLSFKMEM